MLALADSSCIYSLLRPPHRSNLIRALNLPELIYYAALTNPSGPGNLLLFWAFGLQITKNFWVNVAIGKYILSPLFSSGKTSLGVRRNLWLLFLIVLVFVLKNLNGRRIDLFLASSFDCIFVSFWLRLKLFEWFGKRFIFLCQICVWFIDSSLFLWFREIYSFCVVTTHVKISGVCGETQWHLFDVFRLNPVN